MIRDFIVDKLLPTQFMENILPGSNAMADRQNLYELYDDPDWMLQKGLGDIEFEQDMYDDIMYGDSYMSEDPPHPKTQELYENVFGDVPPYDELALMGLRKHAMEGGPRRYLDETPYDVKELSYPWEREGSYLGVHHAGPGMEPNIDINLPLIEKQYRDYNKLYRDYNTDEYGRYRGTPGGLQKNISDTYRHEYKHGVVDNTHPYAHPVIYGTNAMYGLGGTDVKESDWGFQLGPYEYGDAEKMGMAGQDRFGRSRQYNPDKAGDLLRDVTGRNTKQAKEIMTRPSRAQQRLNTGGIASLW